MTEKEKLFIDTAKNIYQAVDMLVFEANRLRRSLTADGNDPHNLALAANIRLKELRKTMDELTDQVATLKLLAKL